MLHASAFCPRHARRLLACFTLLACMSTAWTQSVHRDVLENGVTVISVDRRDTHAVHVLALVRAGPAEEGPLLGTGISRTVQGMILASARKRSNEVARLGDQLSVHGGTFFGNSAEGGSEQASFALSTTDTSFPEALRLLASLLGRPELSEEHLLHARRLLASGEERDLRNPATVALHALSSLALREHPARIPPRGFAERRESLTLEDVQRFHQKYYTGNRMTIVVVGNLSRHQVLSQVKQSFAELPSGEWATTASHSEPVQFAPRHRSTLAPGDDEYAIYGWRTPSLNFYTDHAALDILAVLIQRRLHHRLTQERDGHRLATDVRVTSWNAPRSPGLFTIAFRPSTLGTSDAWFEIQQVLDNLRSEGPSNEELRVSKRLWQREQAALLASVAGTARDLARWEQAVGVPGFGTTFRHTVATIDGDAIKRVSSNLLHPKGANLSSVFLTAAPSEEPTTTNERSALTDVVPRLENLPMGVRLVHRYMPIGLAHVRVTLRGGASIEPQEQRGITPVLAKLLTYGSSARRGDEFRSLLEVYGMDFQVMASNHHLELHMVCFPEDVDQALGILVDVLKQPALPETALDRVIAEHLAVLAREPSTWNERLLRAIDQAMLSDHYGYRDIAAHRETLNNLNRSDILAWHQRLVTTNNMVFSVYGDYDPTNLEARLQDLLAAEPIFSSGEAPPLSTSGWDNSQPAAVTTLTASSGEEAIAFAWRNPSVSDVSRDLPAMEVLASVLTGNAGRGGRLARALSAIGIDPDNSLEVQRRILAGRGYWAVLVKVPDNRIEEVRDLVLDHVGQVVRALTSSTSEHQQALAAAEIAAAKSLAINARILNMEDQGRASLIHARSVLRGASLEEELAYQARLTGVERSDLARVANLYLAPAPILVQLATPQSEPSEIPAEPATAETRQELPSEREALPANGNE